MSLEQWKSIIKKCINQRQLLRNHVNMKLYKSTMYVKCIFKMSAWWVFAFETPCKTKQVTFIIRLLLNVDKYGSKTCEKCSQLVNDSIVHILFSCDKTDTIACELWNDFLWQCPKGLINELNNMSNEERVYFILNAMYSPYIKEWTNIYYKMINFVYTVFMEWME